MEEEDEGQVGASRPPMHKRVLSRSNGSRATSGWYPELASKTRDSESPSDMELILERFAKLLLGEDMSGTGKGVSSALALSNAITNLAASVFGEQRRLEPMAADRRARWNKEVDLLLSVTDYIVDFAPSTQASKDGKTSIEVMGTQQRTDILMNIPALRKLDAMLLEYLDNFGVEQEFWYVKKDADKSEKGDAPRESDKWWIPMVKVPPEGLSEKSRKWLQHQKDLVGQVLKAAMAINANVLSEMEVPEQYMEALPKNGKSMLGDSIYKTITDDHFDPNGLLDSLDLSTEHKIVDLKDRIEASVIIWKKKMSGKISWNAGHSLGKREQFEERAETVLLILKHRFPGIPQSRLEIGKIQYNKDVGFAILESYSRALESLAFAVLSRIEDVLHADNLARDSWRPKPRRASLADIRETFVLGHDADDSDGAGRCDGLDDRGLETSNGAKLKKVPKMGRVATKKFLHIEKIENVRGAGLRSFSQR